MAIRTILLVLYSLGMATTAVFLILDRFAVYPTRDMVLRLSLNTAMALFILALIAGGIFRWRWTLKAGLIFLSMVLLIDVFGAIFVGISVHWPGLVLAITGLPFLFHWKITDAASARAADAAAINADAAPRSSHPTAP